MARQINGDEVLSTALHAARVAGCRLLGLRGKLGLSQIRKKPFNSLVTDADILSESLILSIIRTRFPSHSILSEEKGQMEGGPCRWIIDPLDGTANFVRGLPFFCVSIAVLNEAKPLCGVIYDPVRNEMFAAQVGRGGFLNGRRIRVSRKGSLNGAIVGCAMPRRSLDRLGAFSGILDRLSTAGCDNRQSGALALSLSYVAAGRLDGLWAFDQADWDIAAGALILTESGGRLSLRKTKNGHDLVAATSRLDPVLRRAANHPRLFSDEKEPSPRLGRLDRD